MKREALVIHASCEPIAGVPAPGPNQTYRHPYVTREFRELSALAPDLIRIKLLYVGICGTDLHLVQQDNETGYILSSSPVSIPVEGRIFGHEGLGRIVSVGVGVAHLKVGSIVALESIVVCGRCDRCLRGMPNQCRESQLVGMQRDGLFTTLADVPSTLAHDVSDLIHSDQDLQGLACLEPAAVALVACKMGRLGPGEKLVIFGGGPIGLYTAMLARILFDVGSIHLVEPLAFRRKFASRWCDAVSSPDEFLESAQYDVDVVVEASGCATNIDRVIPSMDAGGRIIMLGRSGEPVILTRTDDLITNAICLMGSRGHLGGAFTTLLDLYRRGLFHPQEIVTRVVDGLEELEALFAAPGHIINEEAKVLVCLNREVPA